MKNSVLIVVDMQNDFIDGSLGSEMALKILPDVIKKVESFDGTVLFTMDTHYEGYPDTEEGRNLPVKHCIHGTEGWKIQKDLDRLRKTVPVEKETFGSCRLGEILKDINREKAITDITLAGVCTDICVISNALLIKSFLPDVHICVDSSCCAGTSEEAHENALKAMRMCQIEIL